ncbi:Uncharacterised protein [Mycobacterium tuberculosis]|nr:Uncharacterised protein [Mycobacterium tuberculosis]
MRRLPLGPTSKCCWPTWCRVRSCSRLSMRHSRSVVLARRTSGAAPGCRHTGGPTPMAPGSPTVRRRHHRRCWRARPSIPGRRCRRDRRAPTPRRRTVCRGRGIRCPALTSLKVHSVAPISRRRWMSRRRRRTQTVHRPPRAYQSRDVRVRCRRTFPARRCRFHRRLPPGHARCPSGRRLVRLRPRRRQARRHHRAPGRSCRPRSSTPAAPAVVA